MPDDKLRSFYEQELNEIKQHKLRFGLIAASLAASIVLFFFFEEDNESATVSNDAAPKVVSVTKDTASINSKEVHKTTSKVTEVIGLKRASADAELINPFKVDIIDSKPPTIQPPAVVPTVPTLPLQQTKTPEPDRQIVLILKGTAISGNRKMAIIQRSVVGKNSSKDSEDSKNKDKSESMMLSLGDIIDGRRIVDISRDFITFDDGHDLYIQEALR